MALEAPIQTVAGLETAFSLSDYYSVLVYLIFVLLFAGGTLFASHLLFVKPFKDTAVKMMPYESGMDPIGSAHMQMDVKYYLIAILFLVFDVELLFLYPWAVIAYSDRAGINWRENFGGIVFGEIIIFLFTLGVAYVYAWRKGVFQWR